MTFGEMVRKAREARAWTRYRLHLTIKEAFKKDGIRLSESAIANLERGRSQYPRAITYTMCVTVLPELLKNESKSS